MRFQVGDLCTTTYRRFDGSSASGLFLIIYSEHADDNTPHNKNVVACKITTSTNEQAYSVPVIADEVDCIHKDCHILCSKTHVMYAPNLYKIGTLPNHLLVKVLKATKSFDSTKENSMLERVLNEAD